MRLVQDYAVGFWKAFRLLLLMIFVGTLPMFELYVFGSLLYQRNSDGLHFNDGALVDMASVSVYYYFHLIRWGD